MNRYAREALAWHGWGSPVGLALGVGITLDSLGLFLWLLHLAGLL